MCGIRLAPGTSVAMHACSYSASVLQGGCRIVVQNEPGRAANDAFTVLGCVYAALHCAQAHTHAAALEKCRLRQILLRNQLQARVCQQRQFSTWGHSWKEKRSQPLMTGPCNDGTWPPVAGQLRAREGRDRRGTRAIQSKELSDISSPEELLARRSCAKKSGSDPEGQRVVPEVSERTSPSSSPSSP